MVLAFSCEIIRLWVAFKIATSSLKARVDWIIIMTSGRQHDDGGDVAA